MYWCFHYCFDSFLTACAYTIIVCVVFFSPLDVCFLLLTTHVHSFASCTSYNDSSIGCCTWSGFFISSTHHSQCTSVISQFVVDDNFFILGLLCYCWFSFCSHESFLHKVFIWFLLIVFIWFFFRFCLLVFSFALYFCYMGSHPWFWFIGFSSYCFGILLLFLLIYHLALLTSIDHHFVIELMQSFNKGFLEWFVLLFMFFEGNNLHRNLSIWTSMTYWWLLLLAVFHFDL